MVFYNNINNLKKSNILLEISNLIRGELIQ